MLALRPTFSESWYRVAALKAKLRPGAQISRQYYRGERWYVVRDPAGNQFHRLSDAAYRFVGLLDGTRTVQEAWELVGGQLDDAAPTQPEVIQIMSQLYAANLLEADITPDATVLLRRHKQLQKRQLQGRLMNVLFPRIPLWDPDRFLQRWMPIGRLAFSKLGAVLWLIVVGAAVVLLGPRWGELKASAGRAISPDNWILLWATFVFVKGIHELGHAFACRRFGGECHELGIMFLVFIPTPYVDASSAWAFPSRWRRMFVGAAGMVVELFFAALAAFVWVKVPYESYPTISGLAYNAMLIASVSTVLFNANPLLRYDGYYMLSDFLEIPNLRQKSAEYTMGLIKRHVFRLKMQQPLPPVKQRVWLFLYGVLSSIYRVFVGIMIVLVVTYQVPILGVLMAIGGVVTWAVVPVVKLVRYLSIEPELHRKRGRAVLFTLGVAAAIIVLIGLIPFPLRFMANGIVEPGRREVLHAGENGFVQKVMAQDGEMVHQGQIILECQSTDLEAQLAKRRADRGEWTARWQAAVVQDQNQQQSALRYIQSLNEEIARLERRKASLTVRAPFDGRLIAPELKNMPGMYVPRGQEICIVAQMDRLVVKAVLEQQEAELAAEFERRAAGHIAADQPNPDVEVRLVGHVRQLVHGMGEPLLVPAAQSTLPHPSLGHSGGGDIPVNPKDPNGRTSLVPEFEMRVDLANPGGAYLPGQRAYLRFNLAKRPLIWQWYRRFLQVIQTRASASKWT
jgi:putative peptide zinc metalloprotease protein